MDTICNYDVTVFVVVVKKDYLRKMHGNDSRTTEYAVTFLLEYLERFLRSRGKQDMVRVVSDSVRAGDRREIEKALAGLIRGNNTLSYMKATHISEIEYADSLSSNSTQAVDIMAYVISRYMRGEKDLESAFSRIETRIWSEGGGRGFWVFEAGTAGRPYNRGRRP